ncbi:MAG TPA: ferritin-like domain-containing protein [Ktedonobacteraceae bacterium]|nr:ferritin-like domain-containing protein [Ktedonobacteraceae bacterium]
MYDNGDARSQPTEESLPQDTNELNTDLDTNEEVGKHTNGSNIAIALDATLDTTLEMQKFYALAKRQAWKVESLSWGKLPPVPEGKGSGEARARRLAIWRSVVTQQLQADTLASLLSSQLLAGAPDLPGRLYYTTMVQDEGRHAEAWLKLTNEVGGVSEPDPYLIRLGELTLNADTLEEKIWMFQVVFEGLVIDRFRQIAEGAPGTILAELCNRLTVDDGIHHGSGVVYEQRLLARVPQRTKRAIWRVSQEMWPLFVQHLMWRPQERSWASHALRSRDLEKVKSYMAQERRLAIKVGLEIDTPPGF